MEKGEIAQNEQFNLVVYAICILKSFNSHISVVVCSFFEFGTVSKWCIRDWVKVVKNLLSLWKRVHSFYTKSEDWILEMLFENRNVPWVVLDLSVSNCLTPQVWVATIALKESLVIMSPKFMDINYFEIIPLELKQDYTS